MNGKLCLGTAQLGMPYGIGNRTGQPDSRLAFDILDRAWRYGIRSVDTAALYGSAEMVLGNWIRYQGVGSEIRVVTKLPLLPDAQEVDLAKWMLASAQNQLKVLGVDILEGILLHRGTDLNTPGVIDGLFQLIETGVCRQVGVSTYVPEEAAHALTCGLGTVQIPYNVLDRRFEQAGYLEEAQRTGIQVYARSPFLQGLLLMDLEQLPPHMAFAQPILKRWHAALSDEGYKPLNAALSFCSRQRGIDHIVLGAETPEQLDGIIEAMGTTIPDSWFEALLKSLDPIEERVVLPYLWNN